jgi:hypothetical protein
LSCAPSPFCFSYFFLIGSFFLPSVPGAILFTPPTHIVEMAGECHYAQLFIC